MIKWGCTHSKNSKQITPNQKVGIYRDDGFKTMEKSTTNVEKKEQHKFAKSIDIKVKIENLAFQIN